MRRQGKVARRRPRGDGTRGALSSSAARSQSTGLNVEPSAFPSDWFVEIDGTCCVTTRASKLFARGAALILTLLVFSLCMCAMSMTMRLLPNYFSMCSIASAFSPHGSETLQILRPPRATVIFDSTLGFPGEGPPASWEMAIKGKRKQTSIVRSTTPKPVPAFQGWVKARGQGGEGKPA